MKLTPAIAAEFSSHMLTHFGAHLVEKESSMTMRAASIAFDIARLFGAKGIASGHEFTTTFTTTIANHICMPAAHRADPALFAEVLTHECQHVAQWNHAKVEMPWLYAREPEARVKMECDAYAAGLAVRQWLTGSLRTDTIPKVVASLVSSYHLRPDDGALATDLLDSHLASMASGIVMAESGREAVRWLTTHHPGLRG